jgi:hypothetical protein
MSYDDVMKDLWGPSEDEVAPSGVVWNVVSVAQYFDRKVRSAPWSNGFNLTHITALAGQLKKWRTAGKTEQEVKALMEVYFTEPLARGVNPGWKDFLSRAEQISVMLPKPKPEKELTPLERAKEIGTLEAFQEVFSSATVAQKYYNKYKEDHG